MCQHRVPSPLPSLSFHIQHTYTTKTITHSHNNLTSFSAQLQINIPPITWSVQEVRESKIGHINAIYPHNAEPEERNTAMG